jgi:predicted extracellular nuclease
VNGDVAPESDETFFVNVTSVTGATVIDAQGLGTIVNDDGLAITLIHDIQGSGSAITGPGPFAVEAIVVGDYQTQGTGQLRGFFIQEEDADIDANPATSEGIFVFCTSCPTAVSVGDKVRVTGDASEFINMSQLSASTAASVTLVSSGNPLPTPASVTLPVPGVPTGNLATATAFINAYFEKFEGMLVTYPSTLTVSEYFELARFGQLILSANGRPRQFTDANLPTVLGYTNHQIDVASRTVILDDTDNLQNGNINTPNTPYYYPQPGLSTTNFLRGGDTITNLTGVLHWSFNGLSGEDAWRIRPVSPTYNYTFSSTNPRPLIPDVDGTVKVASFNVLNYFLTIDTTSSNDSGFCGASGTLDCRGADSAQELARQRTKMLAALSAIDADVFGFMEMENTEGVEPLADIVAGLPGYNYIDTGVIGGDAIRVGIIYKIAAVQPVGDYAILDTSVDPRFIDTRNRPALAQTFEEIATGARFTVVVNHLKSKGSGCGAGDDDTTTGQGNCNGTRTLAAQALADWLASDPTNSGDPDVLIIGDMNSYAKEDPITALLTAGYTDMVAAFGDPNAYGYVFDGQLGYLDHALANASLVPQVAEVSEWHINADEIPLFDYNDDVRDPGERDAFEEESDVLPLYEPNAFRTSDHDPVIIGLTPNAPPTADAGGPYSVNEGSSVTLSASGSDPNGDTLTYAWDLDNNSSFETSGQSVSFDASLLDGPDGPYTVKVRATDPLGLYADDTTTVSVDNVAPTVSASFASSSLSCGTNNATLNISFSDPASADTHTVVINWGDGNTTAIASATSPLAVPHTYAVVGIYNATVSVKDDDNGTGNAVASATVNYNTSGFLQPINPDGTSVFKYNSTIPVKISFTNCDGSVPSNLAPTITLTMVSGSTPGLPINEPVSTSAADITGIMRFSTNQYIYNLATKPLPDPSATYLITVTVPSTGQTVTVQFGLRP